FFHIAFEYHVRKYSALYRQYFTFVLAKVTKPFMSLTVHPCYRSDMAASMPPSHQQVQETYN
ncbi:hypothetical protein ACFMJK_10055, partial [Acinetobacter baumannii]